MITKNILKKKLKKKVSVKETAHSFFNCLGVLILWRTALRPFSPNFLTPARTPASTTSTHPGLDDAPLAAGSLDAGTQVPSSSLLPPLSSLSLLPPPSSLLPPLSPCHLPPPPSPLHRIMHSRCLWKCLCVYLQIFEYNKAPK